MNTFPKNFFAFYHILTGTQKIFRGLSIVGCGAFASIEFVYLTLLFFWRKRKVTKRKQPAYFASREMPRAAARPVRPLLSSACDEKIFQQFAAVVFEYAGSHKQAMIERGIVRHVEE